MSVWSKLRGTIETIFQLGIDGPQLKNNSSVIEARNSADSGYVVVRGATPVANNDLVTKQYADTLAKPIIVSQQFDGNDPLPSNSATEQFYVVSSTGANATIGQLVWDDGSSSGTATVLATLDGRSIFTTIAFAGGTVTFQANAYYVWDAVTSAWLLESTPFALGAVRVIRYALTNANGSQDSATQVPAGAYVLRAYIEVVTPYSGGATLKLGQSGSLSLLMATTDVKPQAAGIYQVPQDTSWGGTALAVRTTVAGAPAAGAGFAVVEYTVPDA